MRWQIEGLVFCEKQQNLTSKTHVLQLEPMVVELLGYFCRHTDQIISRDQLVEQVWRGRLITDNAVTKVINKLRKNLNDDPKKPKFIATFPKKGYKFIASVSELPEQNKVETPNDDQPQVTPSLKKSQVDKALIYKSTHTKLWMALVLIFLLIGIGIFTQYNKSPSPITQVKALTRLAGNEAWPQFSPDGNYLTFMEFGEKRFHLWVKSLIDETLVEITHGESDEFGIGPASYNSDGSKLVYLVASSDTCQYYIRDINGLTLGKPKLIHNCPSGSFGLISFTHDDNIVVYSEADNSPYNLFEMNLATGAKQRLNQPETFVGGNSYFNLHPSQNKLLISSPDKQQWEGYYTLDLDTDELTLLFKQDAYICCGIWDHSGKRIVLMGEHPAYEIVSYALDGTDKQVIYAGSQQLREPLRHINGKDYLFSAGFVNQDALYYQFESQSENFVANTSVDDRLAVFSPQSNQIAFIGLSTGNEEIWLSDKQGTYLRKLTQFNDNRHIVDLVWSPDGDYLAALGLNQIYLIDSKTGASQSLKLPQVEIRGLSFKSAEVIAFSTKSDNGWQVNNYHINTHQVTYEDAKWAYISYSADTDDILWKDNNQRLFVGAEQHPVANEELKDVSLINGRQFNLKKVGTKWAWQKRSGGQYSLMFKDALSQPARNIITTDSYHFDLSQDGLLYHKAKNQNADIYQTLQQ